MAAGLDFRVQVCRASFVATRSVRFGAMAANRFRGAVGLLLDEKVFRPQRTTGPSGLRNPPRPYVFRAHWLDDRVLEPGETFEIAVHLFWTPSEPFRDALSQLGWAHLTAWEEHSLDFDLTRGSSPVPDCDTEGAPSESFGLSRDREGAPTENRAAAVGRAPSPEPAAPAFPESSSGSPRSPELLRIQFLTLTELKGWDPAESPAPSFAVLMARIRDRLSAIRLFYGPEYLSNGYSHRFISPTNVSTGNIKIVWKKVSRTSTHTGQIHALGGFAGSIDYHGDWAPLLPWLKAAQYTGVGRQTVWGKGVIRLDRLPA